MIAKKKVVTVVFGGGVSTLGVDVLLTTAKSNSCSKYFDFVSFTERKPQVLNGCDVLLVSLYWFEDIYYFLRFLKTYGIDPRRPLDTRPLIVLGGIAASNTALLDGFFDYVVLGDGEVVIDELLCGIFDGSHVRMRGVVPRGDYGNNSFVHAKNIPAHAYTEDRGNNTSRIEIARGCRFKCPFCQLAYTKPYREQPLEIVRHLIMSAPTKSIGLFAPDRSGYSAIDELEKVCCKYGKHNTAEDMRMDSVRKLKTISKLKFGIEGFTERSRKKFRKVRTNEDLIDGLKYIFNDLRKPNGKRHTTATAYMIGDLPGENPENASEFWDILGEADRFCNPPFTMFLTLNSFSPKPYTPFAKSGIHPYNDWSDFWKNRPKMKNITIAGRGGMLGPSNRISHLITARGDQRLTKIAFWIANEGRKVMSDRGDEAGRFLEKKIRDTGVDPEYIYGELGEADSIPSDIYDVRMKTWREQ